LLGKLASMSAPGPPRALSAGRTAGQSSGQRGRFALALCTLGIGGLAAAVAVRPSQAAAAVSQDWPPFVLVTGLLLIGLVANRDGLFASAGRGLARLAPNTVLLYLGSVAIVGLVTAVLNLDTSVAFLTPVLVYSARSRGGGEAPLLYGCLLLSNAGSLFLPGSNLTNLIVLGHLHQSGASFLARMWAPALVALLVTALVVGALEHRSLRDVTRERPGPERPRLGLGLVAVVVAAALIITLSSPALPVVMVGVVVSLVRLLGGRQTRQEVAEVLGAPILVGLFGVAVALGTLARCWSGPAVLLSHLDSWQTAAVAAVASVVVNNLPAASLLSARLPARPMSLLIGLDLGPNFFVTGSLAWLLWLRAARGAGAQPSIARASRLGMIAVPLSMAAALGVLALTGSR
jgi:arsenical pump membrane protein